MYALSERTKKAIERRTGIPCDELQKMAPEEVRARIEVKTGKKLHFEAEMNSLFPGRGSPYIIKSRFIARKEINRKFKRVK
jgi:hypothetical protein